MAKHVMNHKKRNHDAGILFPKFLSKKLERSAFGGTSISRDTDVLVTELSEWRYLWRLSRLSFEKQASAGINIAAKLSRTQNATTVSGWSLQRTDHRLLRSQSTSS